MKNPFASERPEQTVEGGGRRSPVLNPISAAPTPAYPSANKTPQKAAAYDYFDNYDDKGNEKDAFAQHAPVQQQAPKPVVAAPVVQTPAKSEPDNGTMFSRFIDSLDEKKAPAPEVRKPLPGNPYVSKATEMTAPVPPAAIKPEPVSKPYPDDAVAHYDRSKAESFKPVPSPKSIPVPEEEIAPVKVEAPVEKPAPEVKSQPVPLMPYLSQKKEPEVKAPEPEPEYVRVPTPAPASAPTAVSSDDGKAFPDDAIIRWNGGSSSQPKPTSSKSIPVASEPVAASNAEPEPVVLQTPEEPAANAKPKWTDRWLGEDKPNVKKPYKPEGDYPPLSSVPPAPSEFKTIKSDKDQDMDNLKQNYNDAQDARKTLGDEPSSQPHAAAPVSEKFPIKDKAPLLGGGNAPPPPFAADLPTPTGETVSKEKRSWWDRNFGASNDDAANAPAATTAPADTTISVPEKESSHLPSPSLLEKPINTDSQ